MRMSNVYVRPPRLQGVKLNGLLNRRLPWVALGHRMKAAGWVYVYG
jgi:hypothetical protein